MKKILITIFCLTFFLGCDSDFLNETNPNTLTPDDFWQDADDAQSAIIGAYSPLSTIFYHGRIWASIELALSDEIVVTGAIGTQAERYNFNPNNGNFRLAFAEMWKVIFRSNLVLQNVPNIDMDATLKDNILGEAYFLRALQYFVLVNHFQNIPLVTVPASSLAETQQPPASPDLVWAQIEADLSAAIPLLPTSWDDSNKGRVMKGSASALLGKAYLYQGNWTAAASELERLIDGSYGTFDLMPNFVDNFRDSSENNIESLFEIQFDQTGAWTAGWGSDVPNTARYSSFDNDFSNGSHSFMNPWVLDLFLRETTNGGDIDPRAYETLVWDYPGAEHFSGELFVDKFATQLENYALDPVNVRRPVKAAKYINPNSGLDAPSFSANGNNKRIIRFADVLLMYAEAENEVNGPTAAAYASINRVRARVDMPDIPAGLSQADFRQRVWDERTLELCNESQRPLDLLRWGLSPSRFVDNPSFRNTDIFYVPGREYYPIPQLELDTNPNYNSQNQGYE
ncbi:MAG: RagB/SusD family nutrient uptake outer membrane protein [Flavobacteriaceae bacterium]